MTQPPIIFEKYPWRKILPRWIFGAIEIGLSLHIVLKFSQQLGLLLAALWAISLLVLLPIIRCSKCYYHGKRCNTAWGLLAGFAFKKGETRYFSSGYGLTMLLWPLRILPIGLGLIGLLDGLEFDPDALFGIYILAILLHRLYYRASNCPGCKQREICPVYDPMVLDRLSDSIS